MPRGFVRAAAYLPRFTDGRCRLGGADEDAFTLAATALERAAHPRPQDDRTHRVRWFGPTPAPEPSALAAVLGSPVRLSDEGREGRSVAGSLEEAASGRAPEWLVAVTCGARDLAGTPAEPPGEGAVALFIDETDAARPIPHLPEASEGPTRTGPFAVLWALGPARPEPGAWVGDWGEDPTRGLKPAPRASPEPPTPPYTVSQGAFVPTARDEESRPSRWRFLADRCRGCGVRTFPARGRCHGCGSSGPLAPEPLPLEDAEVVAVTTIAQGGQPTEFDPQVETSGPYGVVLAQLAPDIRVTMMVADAEPEGIRIGSRVDTVLRRLYPTEGVWRYGRKAVPRRLSR